MFKANQSITSDFKNKRNSHQVASNVMSIQVMKPKMQYSSFYMKNRSPISKNSKNSTIQSKKNKPKSKTNLTEQNNPGEPVISDNADGKNHVKS